MGIKPNYSYYHTISCLGLDYGIQGQLLDLKATKAGKGRKFFLRNGLLQSKETYLVNFQESFRNIAIFHLIVKLYIIFFSSHCSILQLSCQICNLMASSSSTHQWKYDLFLSFRGEDTRKSFTDHLHRALRQSGVLTFMDDQLSRGEEIPPALVKAIEESRFSIVVFSENYAFSTWCLEELVKIIDCTKVMGHATFPVFYKVDPSHVRKQKGTFAQAFAKHEEVYKERMEKVVKWREALTEAAEIAGWDSRDRYLELQFVPSFSF